MEFTVKFTVEFKPVNLLSNGPLLRLSPAR